MLPLYRLLEISQGLGGTVITEVACFVEGTRISATQGEIPVEIIQPGDQLQTRGRGAATVVWVGHRDVDCRRHPRPENVWPVRVRAGAFGNDQPGRDLFLSPDHAVFFDGALIPIRYLVNGATIIQEPRNKVTYWHVELDKHGVIFAEGLPCESYLDTGNRSAFVNGGTAVRMHPDFALRVWEAEACAPLVRDGAKLEAARKSLLERAVARGHATTADLDLRLMTNGRELRPEHNGDGVYRFRLPARLQGGV